MADTKIIAIALVAVLVVAGVAAFVLMDDGDESQDETNTEPYYTLNTPVDYKGGMTTQKFTEVPERVVVGNISVLNSLLYFGLGDRIAGIYYMEEEVWPEIQAEYDKVVNRIGTDHVLTGNISKEVATSWEPDLLVGWVAFTDEKLGSPDYWNALGCNVWAFRTTVDMKDYDGIQQDCKDLGGIFKVTDKTDKFVSDFDDRMVKLKGKVSPEVGFVVFDPMGADEGKFWFYKNTGSLVAYIMLEAGATGVFPDGGTLPLEKVYDECDKIDVVFSITYRDYTVDVGKSYWENNETLSKAPAVVNNAFVGVKLSVADGMSPEILDVMDRLIEVL